MRVPAICTAEKLISREFFWGGIRGPDRTGTDCQEQK
jgi:hypothetical protein